MPSTPFEPVQAAGTEERLCEAHGAYLAQCTAFRVYAGAKPCHRWSPCPPCDAQEQATRKAEAARRAAAAMRQRLQISGLTGRFLRSAFATSDSTHPGQRNALRVFQRFADAAMQGLPGTLFAIGPPGTGKSHLLSATVRHVVERTNWTEGGSEIDGRLPRIVTASELIREIRATWGKRHSERSDADQTEAEVIERYGRCRLLALDDVGANLGTEAEAKHLLDVIDRRYQLELPTVIASNLTIDDLRSTLGERCFDRLREKSSKVVFDWPSLRGQA